MSKSLKHKPADTGGRNWLLPFNDMMTLLLTFFVLILSISKVDTTKVQSASDSVLDAFGSVQEQGLASIRVFDPFVFSESTDHPLPPEEGFETRPWGSLDDRDRLVNALNKMTGIKARLLENGLEASFGEGLFFAAGQAEPASADHPGLRELIDVLKRTEAMVRIEDHTKDSPLEKDLYPSVWELSTTRAARFGGILKNRGIAPRRISISGCGDLRAGSFRGKGSLNRINFILTFKS